MHALAATEKGKKGKSVSAYAKAVGRPVPSVEQEVRAASVATLCTSINFADLVERTRHLIDIHAAPEPCWPALVSRLVEEKWNVEATKKAEMSGQPDFSNYSSMGNLPLGRQFRRSGRARPAFAPQCPFLPLAATATQSAGRGARIGSSEKG